MKAGLGMCKRLWKASKAFRMAVLAQMAVLAVLGFRAVTRPAQRFDVDLSMMYGNIADLDPGEGVLITEGGDVADQDQYLETQDFFLSGGCYDIYVEYYSSVSQGREPVNYGDYTAYLYAKSETGGGNLRR